MWEERNVRPDKRKKSERKTEQREGVESVRDRHRYRQREGRDGECGRWGRGGGKIRGMCHLREKHLEWRKKSSSRRRGWKWGHSEGNKTEEGRQSTADRDLEPMTDSGSSRERIEEKRIGKKYKLPTPYLLFSIKLIFFQMALAGLA